MSARQVQRFKFFALLTQAHYARVGVGADLHREIRLQCVSGITGKKRRQNKATYLECGIVGLGSSLCYEQLEIGQSHASHRLASASTQLSLRGWDCTTSGILSWDTAPATTEMLARCLDSPFRFLVDQDLLCTSTPTSNRISKGILHTCRPATCWKLHHSCLNIDEPGVLDQGHQLLSHSWILVSLDAFQVSLRPPSQTVICQATQPWLAFWFTNASSGRGHSLSVSEPLSD